MTEDADGTGPGPGGELPPVRRVRSPSCWDMDMIRSDVDAELRGRVVAMDRAALEEAFLSLAAATVPFRTVLGAIRGQVRETRYSSRHAHSDLFPLRSPDEAVAEDAVWIRSKGEDRWVPEHEALRQGLDYVRDTDSVQLVDAPLDDGFIILGVSGSEDCASVHEGHVTLGDLVGLERAATLSDAS